MTAISRYRYRLTHHTEEFTCPTCGCAVYVGDIAFHAGDDEPYCAAYCAGADPRQSTRSEAEQRKRFTSL